MARPKSALLTLGSTSADDAMGKEQTDAAQEISFDRRSEK